MELELKWRADAGMQEAVLDWAAAFCIGDARHEMDARYFDTADDMLLRAHAGLRLRLEDGAGVCCFKCGGNVRGAAHLREEYECAAATIDEGLALLPAAGAPRALCQKLAETGIFETCRVQFVRRARTLRTPEMTAELALDCGTLACGGVCAPLCEIELEMKSGDEGAFRAFGRALETAFSLVPEPRSKLARARALCPR